MNLFDLPATWSWQTLLDVAKPTKSSIADGPFGSELKISHYVEEGVPVLQGKNITNDIFRMFDTRFIADEKAEELRRSWVRPGDILMVKIGSIGYSAVIDTLDGFEKAVIPANLAKITPNSSVIDTRFIYRWLTSIDVKRHLKRSASKTAQPALSLTKIKGIPVPVPPLEEQRRIAAILDKADAVRRKRQQAIALTEELLRSAFLNLVSSKHTAYYEWEEVLLADLVLPTKGSTRTGPFGSTLLHSEFVKEGIAVLGIDNAVQNRFAWRERRFITPEKYKGLQQYTVKPGDVIITIMGTTGRSAVVPQDIPLAITTKHLATITLDCSKALPEYISNAIHRDPSVLNQIALQNRGAIMAGLNLGIIKKLKVRLPPLQQQILYDKVINQVRQEQERLEQAANTANDLFNSLIQRAFQGKL